MTRSLQFVLLVLAIGPTVSVPAAPTVANANFEANGGAFTVASGWSTFGASSGKWEGAWYPESAWAQGVSLIPAGSALGVYQQVGPTVPGYRYTLAAYARLTDDRVYASLGIDPAGGSDPSSAVFGAETNVRNTWIEITSPPVTATGTAITLFLRGRNGYTQVLTDAWVLFDRVQLAEEAGPTQTPTSPGPTATASHTATGPTATPTRTSDVPSGVVRLSAEEYHQRAWGMWKGQLAGVQLGAQYEFGWIDEPSPWDSISVPTHTEFSKVDDDNWFEWMYPYFVQEFGWGMGYATAGQQWREHFTRLLAGANEEARGLLSAGYNPPQTGMKGTNSKWFFIDAQIESEVWGLMAAGFGQTAKAQADVWARVTNDGGAVDGATFYALMYAYAMIEQDPTKVLRAAQALYPSGSEVYRLVDRVFQEVAAHPTDWRAARNALRNYTWNAANFDGYVGEHRGIFWATNFAAVLTAILYGQGDYHTAQQLSILQGYDADCNSSTVGGFMGILAGHDRIPSAYRNFVTDNYHNWNGAVTQAPAIDALSSMAAQAQRMFERVLVGRGGWIEGEGWDRVYYIPTDWPPGVPRSTPPPQPTPTYTPVPGPATLRNANLETAAFGGIYVPEHWIPFGGNKFELQWHPGSGSKAAGLAEIPGTVRPYAGLYQCICGALPGHRYRVEADVWQGPTVYRASIGIDPAGWLDYEAAVYGSELAGNGRVSHTAVAQDGRLTVFLRVRNLSGAYNTGWTYFDNVTLVDEGAVWTPSATPTATPTDTPPLPDGDGDQLPDAVEDGNPPAPGRTNRYLPDSDGDGLLDGAEDADRDGERDGSETDPRAVDSDGDGLGDGVERLLLGSDPSNPASPGSGFPDADGDGLPDLLDLADSDPDTDDDRFTDGYEAVMLGLGAEFDPGRVPGLGDANGDGFVSNLDALVAQSLFLGTLAPATPGILSGRTDLNRDGATSNVDALAAQSFFLNTLARLPL